MHKSPILVKFQKNLPFVICAGSGDGHCRGVCTFVVLAPVDDKGRSNDEHLCDNEKGYEK